MDNDTIYTAAAGSGINITGTALSVDQYDLDGTGLDATTTVGGLLVVDPTEFMEPIQYTYTATDVEVNNTTATIRSDSLAAPVAGTVLVTCQYVFVSTNLSSTNTSLNHYYFITTSATGTYSTNEPNHLFVYYDGFARTYRNVSFQRRYAQAAGTTTYYCRGYTGTDDSEAREPRMSLVFIPN